MEQNLNHYKIFYEAAKTGNISKAADNLYLSQPAVSKSITKLEQSLGQALFIRSKKGVKMTEEGKMLFDYLKQAFDSIDTAEKNLRRRSQFGISQLRIGVSTSLCKHILLPYLQDYIRENPHVKVSIECNPTYETIQLLRQNKIDIGLICDTLLDRGYHFSPLRSIHDTFVTTQTYLDNLLLREKDSPIANESSLLSLEQKKNSESVIFNSEIDILTQTPNIAGLLLFSDGNVSPGTSFSLNEKEILEKCNLMLLDKENISRIFIDEYFIKNHINPGQVLEINNMDLLIDFAAIGMGIACVVREFITSYLESGQVIELPLEHEIPQRTIGFIYPEHGLDTTAGKFLEFCR